MTALNLVINRVCVCAGAVMCCPLDGCNVLLGCDVWCSSVHTGMSYICGHLWCKCHLFPQLVMLHCMQNMLASKGGVETPSMVLRGLGATQHMGAAGVVFEVCQTSNGCAAD